jgi:2-polyprenyl-6-methoxyphenol hydroxylase-like FAD-dependent oxidoreductase
MPDTPVLIVGGGPVGLSLAAELAWRGTACMLVEERTAPTEHPKATLLGARSMEYFRRWGIADEVFAAAIPEDVPYSITFSTRLTGHLLHRIVSPSIRETRTQAASGANRNRELAWSPYYKTQIGQQALEPVLWRFAGSQRSLALRHGWRFLDFTEDEQGVSARIVELASGREEIVPARYLVGCDGGTSAVRKQLGIRYNGRGQMRANVSFYFRSTDFLTKHRLGVCNLYFIFTPDSFGVFTAIDGKSEWLYQHYFLDKAKETRDLDAREVLWRAMGAPFEFELRGVQHWHHHQSVARQWRSQAGRVFIAGDAAHLFVPTGGVGMNTGIGDAIDLGWKLDATLKGWGGAALLASYEAERKPIAVRNSVISANNSDKIDMVMDETPADIERDDAAGDALRAALNRKIRWMARQFNSAGTHLGYRYVDSPIVVPDGTPEPPDDFMQVVPSTWPGSRAPHAWLADGRSTLDLFGPDFTLVRTGEDAPDPGPIVAAAERAGVPLRVQSIDAPELAALLEHRLVLVRPDGHVAWRGNAPPSDAEAMIARVRGASVATAVGESVVS